MFMYLIRIHPHNHSINDLSIDRFIRLFLYPGFLPGLSYANLKIIFAGKYVTDIDDYFNNTCVNGGHCMGGVNTYTCNCPPGFGGMY